MNKSNVLLFFFLVIFSNVFGQLDLNRNIKVKQYAYKIDTTPSKFTYLGLKIDTIQVKAKKYNQKVIANCLFDISKSFLTICYYLKGESLILISVKEQSPIFESMYFESLFFYNNETLFDEEYSSTVRPCVLVPKNKTVYELYGYNPSLNELFLKHFVLELYKKLE